MMEFPMVNLLLSNWEKMTPVKPLFNRGRLYAYDKTDKGITKRILILKDMNSSVCYLFDHYIINRFNVKKKSHIDIMKEALEDLEITCQELIQKGLEER